MRCLTNCLAMLGMTIPGTLALGGDTLVLHAGEYEVDSRLELPHVEDMGFSKVANICVTQGDGGTHGLVVLSENNPLSRCPASNVRQDADTLSFDIVCPGHNQAIAWAKYTLGTERFSGAIAMKMGGKNMTMTERQTGRRVGDCKPVEAPHS